MWSKSSEKIFPTHFVHHIRHFQFLIDSETNKTLSMAETRYNCSNLPTLVIIQYKYIHGNAKTMLNSCRLKLRMHD